MEFRDGVSVYTSDGKDAGNLRRVVIEPDKNEVTHIVVQNGLLMKEDKVVPVVNIASTSPDRVDLNCPFEEFKVMSPLKIKLEVPLNDAPGRGGSYDPLSGGGVGWNTTIKETKWTISEDLVALKEGAQVVSEDDEHVGNIECVYADPETNNVTHFRVTQGLLAKTRKSIPIQWVTMLDEDKVQVSIAAREFDDLLSDQEAIAP